MATVNFQGPIPVELKESIDKLIAEADIPIGKVVRRLAEWCSEMDAEQLRMFVYGQGGATLADSIQQQVREFFESERGRTYLAGVIEPLVTDYVVAQSRSRSKRKRG